jgi:hypothetical protein
VHGDGAMGTGMALGMGLWWILLLALVILGIIALAKYIFGERG